MSVPYIGEIRMFAGNFAPEGWQFCAGQLLPISEYDALFNLIGTTYGGDGQFTFALPNLCGRVPVHPGTGFTQGEAAGTETVTLIASQIPLHTHTLRANVGFGDSFSPADGVLAESKGGVPRYAPTGGVPMSGQAVSVAGGSQPHANMMPSVAVNYIISLFGIFPSPA